MAWEKFERCIAEVAREVADVRCGLIHSLFPGEWVCSVTALNELHLEDINSDAIQVIGAQHETGLVKPFPDVWFPASDDIRLLIAEFEKIDDEKRLHDFEYTTVQRLFNQIVTRVEASLTEVEKAKMYNVTYTEKRTWTRQTYMDPKTEVIMTEESFAIALAKSLTQMQQKRILSGSLIRAAIGQFLQTVGQTDSKYLLLPPTMNIALKYLSPGPMRVRLVGYQRDADASVRIEKRILANFKSLSQAALRSDAVGAYLKTVKRMSAERKSFQTDYKAIDEKLKTDAVRKRPKKMRAVEKETSELEKRIERWSLEHAALKRALANDSVSETIKADFKKHEWTVPVISNLFGAISTINVGHKGAGIIYIGKGFEDEAESIRIEVTTKIWPEIAAAHKAFTDLLNEINSSFNASQNQETPLVGDELVAVINSFPKKLNSARVPLILLASKAAGKTNGLLSAAGDVVAYATVGLGGGLLKYSYYKILKPTGLGMAKRIPIVKWFVPKQEEKVDLDDDESKTPATFSELYLWDFKFLLQYFKSYVVARRKTFVKKLSLFQTKVRGLSSKVQSKEQKIATKQFQEYSASYYRFYSRDGGVDAVSSYLHILNKYCEMGIHALRRWASKTTAEQKTQKKQVPKHWIKGNPPQIQIKSPFDILGLEGKSFVGRGGSESKAADKSIRAAYRKKAKELHPDRSSDKGEVVVLRRAEEFKAVNAAYQKIKDVDSRKIYENSQTLKKATTPDLVAIQNNGTIATWSFNLQNVVPESSPFDMWKPHFEKFKAPVAGNQFLIT